MSKLQDDIQEIIADLDPDGDGFLLSEAVDLLIHRYVTAGLCLPDGTPKPEVRQLMLGGTTTVERIIVAMMKENIAKGKASW
jgi:hypothetical protein